MDILQEITRRFTARSFDGRPVDPGALERILESGRLAPSAKNRQTWRFIAVTREDMKHALSDAAYGDERLKSAGCVIVSCTTNIRYTMPNGQLSYPLDMAFALSHMIFQATHENLGTALLGTYNEKTVKELLTVPHAMRAVLLLAIGHSSDAAPVIIDRLPAERVISYEHW